MQKKINFDGVEKFSRNTSSEILPLLIQALMTDEGVNFHNFESLFGIDFSWLLSQPALGKVLDYFRICGMEFIKTDDRIVVKKETRTRGFFIYYYMGYLTLGL